MFPTGVGMNRPAVDQSHRGIGVPHRRGDEPDNDGIPDAQDECSPQAWG